MIPIANIQSFYSTDTLAEVFCKSFLICRLIVIHVVDKGIKFVLEVSEPHGYRITTPFLIDTPIFVTIQIVNSGAVCPF